MVQEIIVDEAFIAEMDKYREKPDPYPGLLAACKDNIVLFCEKMVGIRLYAWQVYFLKKIEASVNAGNIEGAEWVCKKFLALTSRQIGKSTALALLSLWLVTFNKIAKTTFNNTQIGIVSATDEQARKLLLEIRKHIRSGDRFMADNYKNEQGESIFPIVEDRKTKRKFGFFSALVDEESANNTKMVSFKAYAPQEHGQYLLVGSKSGSVIFSFPPTAIILGNTLSMLMEDEAGKSDKLSDDFHRDMALPTISSTDGYNILTSTPWQPSGFFYEACDVRDERGSEYERVLFTCEAIRIENPKQYARIQEEIKSLRERGYGDVARRQYYCEFIKGEASYFTPDDVFDCFSEEYEPYEHFRKPCDLGVDFGGKTTSRTAITVSALCDDGIVRRLYHKVYEVQQDDMLLEDIAELMSRFNIQRVVFDDCPAAQYIVPQMQNRGWNLHPMNFRSEKVAKYGAFRATLRRREIKSYRDSDLQTEMLALEFSQGSKQSVIQHAPGERDDLIDSFVMSCYFFVAEEAGFNFYDVNEADDSYDPYVQ